ncbi:MAG: ABC transporter ATP-binding protein [Pseudomonadota bacterium]
MSTGSLIAIDGLSLGYRGPAGDPRLILRDITLSLSPGETVGLVGESGSGKSTLALAMMGYLGPGLEIFSGRVLFEQEDIFALSEEARRKLRGKRIALIPQSAGQSLTPTLRVRDQIDEALRLHTPLNTAERRDRLDALLHQVRLPPAVEIADRYPHQLSGGQQQRVAIAMALGSGAKALILDEPTTGLDVTTQAHILTLLRRLAQDAGVTMITVSHDLGVIAQLAEQIAVMYAGEVVEWGSAAGVLSAPAHPYPRALLASIPRLDAQEVPAALEGVPPLVGDPRQGCAFAPRCSIAKDACHASAPPIQPTDHGTARCFFPAGMDVAPERLQRPQSPRRTGVLVLEARDLSVRYGTGGLFARLLRREPRPDAVAQVEVQVRGGETLGLVGESGSGKSTILRALAGLTVPRTGQVAIVGQPVAASVSDRAIKTIQPLQMIFQNADSALNPRQTVREILDAPLRLYFDLSPDETVRRLADLMAAVRLPSAYLDRFPSQLSGGEKQRIGIARAFAAEPRVVLCDEVTSALDVSVQAAVLRLIARLQESHGTGYVFVSHDLAVVQAVADRIAVLYQGRLCEVGPAAAVFAPPYHPYTQVLMGAILTPDPSTRPALLTDDVIEGAPLSVGCPFQNRCPHKIGSICQTETPPARRFGEEHSIACHIDPATLCDLTSPDTPAQRGGPATTDLP